MIDDVNEAAESISFHFVGTPDARHAQGMENIVRRTPSYAAWRSAYTAALAGSPASVAHGETSELWLRVLAEHPIHGGSRFPHPAVAARRAAASGQTG